MNYKYGKKNSSSRNPAKKPQPESLSPIGNYDRHRGSHTSQFFVCVPMVWISHFFPPPFFGQRFPLPSYASFNFLVIPHVPLFLPTRTPARQGGNHITQLTRAKQLNCSNCGLYHIEIQLFWEDTVTICKGENFLQAQN